MNLSAIFPRIPGVSFQPRHASPPAQPATTAPPAQRRLSRSAIMTLDNRRLRLRVLSGWVWITRDGCPADTVLSAGDVFEQHPGARVLVQALEEAEILIAGAGTRAEND